jgi:acyl carrier protein phosphodiesterase
MSIVQFTRFKSDKAEEMVKTAKQAKTIFEKHGAEFLRLSRFHTGMWAGEWLVATRYSNWEVYGKVQEGLSKDPAFAKLMAHTSTVAELMGRNIAVGIDL